MILNMGGTPWDLGARTYMMGILNVTPDSFSDGGRYNGLPEALEQAGKMVAEGADILDVGGESTRPGHQEVSATEETERVVPVIRALSAAGTALVSIDTSKAAVAQAALAAGAVMVNDVWGFRRDPDIAAVTAQSGAACCLMHNRIEPDYVDFWKDMLSDMEISIETALRAGVTQDRIVIDPGVGFGKTVAQNLEVLRHLERFAVLGFPVLLGTSRKSVIGRTLDLPVDQRLEGTLATTVMGITKGARIIRVHDVEANRRAARMTEAILGADFLKGDKG